MKMMAVAVFFFYQEPGPRRSLISLIDVDSKNAKKFFITFPGGKKNCIGLQSQESGLYAENHVSAFAAVKFLNITIFCCSQNKVK